MPDAVIVDAVRTPIGRAAKGSLKDVRTDDLAAVPLRALVERNPEVDFGETNDLMMGCGFQLGEAGYNIGRNAALLAGIDYHVPATSVTASAPRRCRRSGWPSTRSRSARATSTWRPESRRSRRFPRSRPTTRTRSSTGPRAPPSTSISRWGSGRERRRALRRVALGAGRVGGGLPAARGRRARLGPLRRRDRARDVEGRRPGRAQAGRHADLRHRRRGAQRGLRRPGRAVPRGTGAQSGAAEPVRRRDRPRPPVRDDRGADHDDAAERSGHVGSARSGWRPCASPAAWARR